MTDRPTSEERHEPSPAPDRPRRGRVVAPSLVAAGVVGVAAFFLVWKALPSLSIPEMTGEEVRELAWSAIEREAAESFLVTGSLDVLATTEVENTRRLFPGILDLSLGTTRATVRVPGTVLYGVDTSELREWHVTVGADSVVRMVLPPVEVRSVQPHLGRMEVRTEVGWARMRSRSGVEAERDAIELITGVLHRQGAMHLKDSDQPRRNTEEAVRNLVEPVLEAAGLEGYRVEVSHAERTSAVWPPPGPAGRTAGAAGPEAKR